MKRMLVFVLGLVLTVGMSTATFAQTKGEAKKGAPATEKKDGKQADAKKSDKAGKKKKGDKADEKTKQAAKKADKK